MLPTVKLVPGGARSQTAPFQQPAGPKGPGSLVGVVLGTRAWEPDRL